MLSLEASLIAVKVLDFEEKKLDIFGWFLLMDPVGFLSFLPWDRFRTAILSAPVDAAEHFRPIFLFSYTA